MATGGELQKITIAEGDVSRLELPEGYKVVREKTRAERVAELQERIALLQAQRGQEPSIEELAELGKMDHPYYRLQEEIEALNEQIKKWQKL